MARGEGLRHLQTCLADGRLDDLRRALATLDDEDRELLEAEIGVEGTRRLYRCARRRRRARAGRVVVINGIMGALLDVIKKGDRDRVWVNYWRLFNGRIRDLRFQGDGSTSPPGVRVEVAGLHKSYMALVLELDSQWDVLQFPFDWRRDLRDSARSLAAAVRGWANGEPVHIVAHSMGGLVSRAFIRLFPNQWRDMLDPGREKGGRLVMLGTPNRGSFAVSLMLTAEEKLVKQLALLDRKHKAREITTFVRTFPGPIQMLPSPLVDLDDDHGKLYKRAAWGSYAGRQAFLDDAAKFHQELHAVDTPDRLVYVAGYDQETPHRVRVVAPGEFEYQTTREGDGRVPHVLGLLPGVPTLWVREVHGDLPGNGDVLAGIHELLRTGETSALESTPPARRRSDREGRWVPSESLEPETPEFETRVEELKRATRGRKTEPPPTLEAARVEALVAEDWVGTSRGPKPGSGRPDAAETAPAEPVTLKANVYWGDIRNVAGDVYCVGHYEGVVPQRAEWALDAVVSLTRPERRRLDRLVEERDWKAVREEFPHSDFLIRSLTDRGVLRGALGDVNIYPWADPRDRHKLVAIAGMGRPGTFSSTGLRELGESIAWTVGSLPGDKTVCTVLIGSGEGGMGIDEAARGLMEGIGRAVARGLQGVVREIRLVERDFTRARDIHDALRAIAGSGGPVRLRVGGQVRTGRGGRIDDRQGLAFVLAAAADATRARGARRSALNRVLSRVPAKDSRRKTASDSATRLAESNRDLEAIARSLRVGFRTDERPGGASEIPARITFTRRGRGMRVSAINDTAVAPERDVGTDFALVEELTERTTDPDPGDLGGLACSLRRRLVPRDFREFVSRPSAKVFVVDRNTAAVHWELMAIDDESEGPAMIGLEHPISRQLLTEYSPRPEPRDRPSGRLRALVIGDPGDPEEGDDLEGAREEAHRVADFLEKRNVEVTRRIGAPRGGRTRWGGPTGPATRLEVLKLLDEASFDILHYCGHGDFDPEDPRRTGWVFKGGLLTAGDLETVDRVPRLIVANACLSARTSEAIRGGRLDVMAGEAGLLPSLADEFLRRGVHNYVGTAWEVSDEGAILFATTLYGELLGFGARESGRGRQRRRRRRGRTNQSRTAGGRPLGEALLAARKALAAESRAYGALWLGYQHYGDPAYEI